MNMQNVVPIVVRKAEVWPLVQAAYPDYTGRKFKIQPCTEVTVYNTNWDGGSRNYYSIVSLLNIGQVGTFEPPAPWDNKVEGGKLTLKPGYVIVRRSYFQGHDMGILIYTHPDNMTKMLTNGGR